MSLDNAVLAGTDGLRIRLVAEMELSAGDHTAVSTLLVATFPEHAETFHAASWYGGRPDHRLWLEDSDGTLVAHLDFERRLISVGDEDILVAGVGEVATHPDHQGKGLGRLLMAALRRLLTTQVPADFGYLGCREDVVGFYKRVGWHRIHQKTRETDPRSRQWTISYGPTLILPATAPLSAWPSEGMIDLRGMWW